MQYMGMEDTRYKDHPVFKEREGDSLCGRGEGNPQSTVKPFYNQMRKEKFLRVLECQAIWDNQSTSQPRLQHIKFEMNPSSAWQQNA